MTLARSTGLAVLALAAVAFTSFRADAMYMRIEAVKVPVDRLAKNLEEQIAKDPKDVKALVNLARVHAMAYTLKSEELPTYSGRGKDKDGPPMVWFGYEPKLVPFGPPMKTEDEKKLKAAREHLERAIKLYTQAAELKPDDLTILLGLAWTQEQAGKKDAAIAGYRKVIEAGWAKEKDLRALGLGGHTFTTEAAGYLVPLLDETKDKDEIAELKDRIAKLKQLPRPITPIAVPLRPGLSATQIEDRNAAVRFDADGTGLRKEWTWINGDAAWLVHDPKATGKITSGLQLFGNVTFWLFWENGYQALAALDDNGDGSLTGGELTGLALWHDVNRNGVSDPGEVKPLAEWGIVALNCKWECDETHPDRIAQSRTGVTFKDGTVRPTFDLVLHPAR